MAVICGFSSNVIVPLEECGTKPARGVNPITYLLNHEEYEQAWEYKTGSTNIVETITLAGDADAYKLQSRAGALIQPTSSGSKGEFTQSLVYTMPYISPELAAQFEKGQFGRYVLIQPMANRTIRIFGHQFGLEMNEINEEFTETGTPIITFGTNEETNLESSIPKFFENVDYPTSIAYLESLLPAA